jgi:two-component system NtrC family sensor kinase
MKTNVLVVDDEKDFVTALTERLEGRGFCTAAAFDGTEVFRWLNQNSCDVVVLDIGLPGKSGMDLLPEIKRSNPVIQVIFLTAASDVQTAVAGMKLGANDYLIKPVVFERLVEGIRQAQARRADEEKALRMIETNKMAALGVMAEGVAHEILNPVNIMVNEAGWIEDLLDDNQAVQTADRDEFLSSLNRIKHQGSRCREILAKLLAFGGTIDLRPRAVTLNEFLVSALEKFHRRAEAQRVCIQTELTQELPAFFIPPEQLRLVVDTIADNALDAMADEGGVLRVRTLRLADVCAIEFADTGKGIAKGDLGRIFEPFFSTKAVGKGTGLGLSSSYRVVKSLGGEIRVNSTEGRGTTVTVSLPLPKEEKP